MIGEILSHYRILERIGEGGMGVVFKAQDLKLGRFVALKFLAPFISADLQFRERFLREAKAVSSLDHPNICTIYEIGETDDGQLFMAMAYCLGEPLATRLKRGRLAVPEALDLCIQSARGLEHAHQRGVIHRDIKPANLMISSEGVVKIVDFGLAKQVGEPELTNPGIVVGTVAYLAPEQLRFEGVDQRADVWALGVTLYQLISGHLPFGASSEGAIVHSILNEPPRPLSTIVGDIPAGLENAIQNALQKNPRDRYQSARHLLLGLRAVKRQFESDENQSVRSSAMQAAIVPPSIAVLPFANMSPAAENEYFSDGLTEELINCLSRLPGLRVVSRTSVFQFKGRATNIQEIGRQLNVSTVLEGGVRKSSDRLRVTAQLFSVADGYQLWSERFDRTMKDVFEIQDEIASNIASKLRIRLAGLGGLLPTKRYTQNLEAYHLYLKGRFHWSKRTGDGFQKALEYFELALSEDPNFALAYAGLADCHILMASWGLAPAHEAWPKAEAEALKAVELGPAVAEGHVSLGYVLMVHKWDWALAEREYVQAISLNPGCALAHMQYSMCLVAQGRLSEALVEIERALEVDPLSLPINAYLAGALYYSGEYDRAIQQCQRALEIDADDIETHIALGLIYEAKKMFDEAIEAYDRARLLSGGAPLIIGVLGGAYAKAGRKEQALEFLDQLNEVAKQAFVTPSAMALIYIGLEERDLAFEYVFKACEAHDTLMCYLGVAPFFDSLRSDSRFVTLLEMVNLVGPTRPLAAPKMDSAQEK